MFYENEMLCERQTEDGTKYNGLVLGAILHMHSNAFVPAVCVSSMCTKVWWAMRRLLLLHCLLLLLLQPLSMYTVQINIYIYIGCRYMRHHTTHSLHFIAVCVFTAIGNLYNINIYICVYCIDKDTFICICLYFFSVVCIWSILGLPHV